MTKKYSCIHSNQSEKIVGKVTWYKEAGEFTDEELAKLATIVGKQPSFLHDYDAYFQTKTWTWEELAEYATPNRVLSDTYSKHASYLLNAEVKCSVFTFNMNNTQNY